MDGEGEADPVHSAAAGEVAKGVGKEAGAYLDKEYCNWVDVVRQCGLPVNSPVEVLLIFRTFL